MCGRYFRRSDKQELAERVRAGVIDSEIPELLQHYNIAPTTFQPNELTADVHTRMPVILHESDWDEWMLREGPAPVHLLRPFPADEMSKRPVSKDVGNVRNNHPELLNSK